MRKKTHWDLREELFEHIWNNADDDGIWKGGAAGLARELGIRERSAQSVLAELCDVRLIEQIGTGQYAVVDWPEAGGREGRL